MVEQTDGEVVGRADVAECLDGTAQLVECSGVVTGGEPPSLGA